MSKRHEFYSARVTIDGIQINPRKVELGTKLILRFKRGSEDLKIMESWFATVRTPGAEFKREVLVEFERGRRHRLRDAYPTVCKTVKDSIGRERIEYVVRFGGQQEIA